MAFAIRNRRGARVGARRGQRFATRPTPARSFQQYANSGAQVFFFAFFFPLPAISFLMRFTEAPETNMSIELSPPWSLRARFHEWTDDSSDKPSRLTSPSSVMWIILTMVTSRHSVRRGIISYVSGSKPLHGLLPVARQRLLGQGANGGRLRKSPAKPWFWPCLSGESVRPSSSARLCCRPERRSPWRVFHRVRAPRAGGNSSRW